MKILDLEKCFKKTRRSWENADPESTASSTNNKKETIIIVIESGAASGSSKGLKKNI